MSDLNESLKRLTEYVRVPKDPILTGTKDQWRAVEKKLGLSFPKDYRALFETYGYGAFGEFSPFSAFAESDCEDESDLEFQIRMYREGMEKQFAYNGVKYILTDKERTFETQVSTWPDRPGLFPIARDSSSILRAYHTKDTSSDLWTVAESEVHELVYFDTNLTIIDYLLRMIEGPMIPSQFHNNSIYAEEYHKAKYYPFIRDGSEWGVPESV